MISLYCRYQQVPISAIANIGVTDSLAAIFLPTRWPSGATSGVETMEYLPRHVEGASLRVELGGVHRGFKE